MKPKRYVALFLACTATYVSFSACGGKGEKISKEPNVLNVKIYEGGYGTEYIHQLKTAFESTFAEEGYKLNILSPRTDLSYANLYQEIYTDSGVDVYFAGGVAQDGVYGEYGKCFADITESVLNQKAIRYDGTEEDQTIAEKIIYNFDQTIKCDDGKYYGLPHAMPIGGFAVNKKILDSINLELPVTTNDLFACSDAIMADSAAKVDAGVKTWRTAVKPFTYALTGNNYPMGSANVWMAQYSGAEEHAQFWAFSDNEGKPLSIDGTINTNPSPELAEIFYEEKVSTVLKAMFTVYDPNTCVTNTGSQSFIDAQTKLMQGKAVFCPTGDWFFNEMYRDNQNSLNDVVFIKIPILSELGVQLYGAGTKYNLSEQQCETVLKTIAVGADTQKTIEEIQAELQTSYNVSIDKADIQKAAEARGYVTMTTDDGIYISEKSTKKEVAAKFLRMCASVDGGKTFSKYTRTTSPYAIGEIEEEYPWMKSVNTIVKNGYLGQISTTATGYRKAIGVTDMFYQKYYLASYLRSYKYNGAEVTIFNAETLTKEKDRTLYSLAGSEVAKSIYNDAVLRITNKDWELK